MTTHHTTESVERLGNWLAVNAGPNQIDQWNALIAERDDLRARLEEAEAVLKPLADMAHVYDPEDGDGEDVCWSAMAAPQIKHLRAARAVLNGGGNG